MTGPEAAQLLLEKPQAVGRALGFTRLTDLHGEWIRDMVRGTRDRTLMAHRGSYKTTCVEIALAVQMLLLPGYTILFMRKTDDDVKEVLRSVKGILSSPVMQALAGKIYGFVPKLTVTNTGALSTQLAPAVRGTPQLTGLGVNASLTGRHYDRIFTDDIVNLKDRLSPPEREHTKLIYQELQNLRNRGGRIYNTGTPWHRDDCFALMPDIQRFDCAKTGLITPEQLAQLRQSMSPSLFAANYELRHRADEDILFEPLPAEADPALAENGLCHVDAAYGGKDYTALTVCRRAGQNYYIYGRLWQAAAGDVIEDIVSLCGRFRVGAVHCEDNADKGYFARELRRRGLRTAVYHESMNKYMKITSHLRGAWRNIVFVRGTDEAYLQQIFDYSEYAAHDDAPDSAACAVRAAGRLRGPDRESILL